MAQQPAPGSHCSPHTQPPPAPAPAPPPPPTISLPPAPTPTPTPAPPPIDCHNLCVSDCDHNCTASYDAGLSQCQAQAAADFNDCYASCTSEKCPGKSCEHSGCGVGNCTCDNPNASNCCQECAFAASSIYTTCRSQYGGSYVYYCMLGCTSSCFKTCP
ncbi:hypothetical protein HU200_058312 [Digitaria exilis]|uniref:Uncharacterized protein n=1 Tax=Digitaria exilis TaxID=1010633 RepID=A0A835ADI7_9POAL|nr:hypothetical protein HU200_058312 [Digitaria exilis]